VIEFTLKCGRDHRFESWLQSAADHVNTNHPDVKLYTWIHIACEGYADDGTSSFFHIPSRSDPSSGSFVHTTMFYTLDHPAPVYRCEDFSHQIDYMRDVDGERALSRKRRRSSRVAPRALGGRDRDAGERWDR